jgi:UDP-N-acetylmuramyl tripeptide synthase
LVPGVIAGSSCQNQVDEFPLRTRLAAVFGRGAARLSRLAGREGSVIGGRVALALAPGLLAELTAGRRVVVVSATNGKTTTTRLISAALRDQGGVATNAYGANMPAGHAAALVEDIGAEFAVLECDEKYLPGVLRETRRGVAVLMNLSRDQMDRAAELRLLADRWREALARSDVHVVANCDDPLVVWAASSAASVTWTACGQYWREDSWSCPRCGGPVDYPVREERGEGVREPGLEARGPDGVGWACRECGFARPVPGWRLVGDRVIAPDGGSYGLSLSLPGRANRSNAAMALVVCVRLGVAPEQALARFAEITSVAGRYLRVEDGKWSMRLLLAKNPAGWLEAFDVLQPAPSPVAVSINARGPDGADTSWLWDVDYRALRGRQVYAMGERRLDLAVRLEAAGVDFDVVKDVADLPSDRIDVIANYTAFQEIRRHVG